MLHKWLLLIILTIYIAYGLRVFFNPNSSINAFDVNNNYPELATNTSSNTPIYETSFASNGQTKLVHSAAVTTINNNRLIAFWYGGSREGAKDVAIYKSYFNNETQKWSNAQAIIDRTTVAKDTHRYIRKLGNPVTMLDKNNRLWLFFVSVSVGGWAGSAINVTYSDDFGNTFSPIQRLISSPFINISTLVKNPPIPLVNGRLALPAYHEFMGKFGEVLYLDETAQVVDKRRLANGRYTLQPSIVALSEKKAYAFMRYARRAPPYRIVVAKTENSGDTWSDTYRLGLPNPDAAVLAYQLSAEKFIMIYNHSTDERNDLSLAYSDDQAQQFKKIFEFELEESEIEHKYRFGYPSITETQDGIIHLLYTWNRTNIKHIQFNRAWLEQQL